MFLNIITPCSRPYNLIKIEKSINIPPQYYRWIIVYDSNLELEYKPKYCEIYNHQNKYSIFGNGQRNFALKIINDGHIYFNDDDTTIHENLWENINELKNDFISFDQNYQSNKKRLDGRNISLNNIDSHNFVVHKDIGTKIVWTLNKYNADGIYAVNCYRLAKNPIYLNKTLSIYNNLRENK
jgi:hypothetical protein